MDTYTHNTSELGDKVFLTDEELVELKLTQKEWIVQIGDCDSITHIITDLYVNTNLLEHVVKDTSDITQVNPVTDIILLQLGVWYGTLHSYSIFYPMLGHLDG